MREIKFRVWDGKKMWTFDYKNCPKLVFCHSGWFSYDHDMNYVGSRETKTNGESDILIQYTGLKDKNGKEIYEGDIIKVFANGTQENYHDAIQVIYSDRWAEFKCVAAQSLSHYIQLYYEFEVIGNIHENPELLES